MKRITLCHNYCHIPHFDVDTDFAAAVVVAVGIVDNVAVDVGENHAVVVDFADDDDVSAAAAFAVVVETELATASAAV